MSALQSRIAAFESLAGGATSHGRLNAENDDHDSTKTPSASLLIDAPLSAATAAALQPPVVLTPSPPKHSPSPSPPNLGRKTSLIDLDDWMLEPEEKKRNTGLLINLDSSSPPKPKPTPPSPSKKPPLPPRQPSYTSVKSAASSSSIRSGSSPNAHQAFLYPPRPRPEGGMPLTVNTMELLNHNNGGSATNSRHTQGSSISSFHSVSLSSDTGTDVSTPGSISNFIATYPVDSTDSLTESFEDVSASSISPATERNIHLEFEKARAKAANRSSTQTVILPSAMLSPQPSPVPPKLPQRPSPPNSARTSLRSPPPLPSRSFSQRTATGGESGSSTPRSTPASPVSTPLPSNMIPTTYAVRRAPPPPPSRTSFASDRSSIHSAFSTSSSGHSHNSRVMAFNHHNASLSALAAATHNKRPTPVPLAARKRYEKVFRANVVQRTTAVTEQQAKRKRGLEEDQRKKENGFLSPDSMASPGRGRRAAGWRGLSVDLITGDPDSVAEQLNSAGSARSQKDKGKARQNETDSESDEEDLVKVRSQLFKREEGGCGEGKDEAVGPNEKLEGSVVRLIWKRSGLEKRRLADIWNECDPTQGGSLDMEAFVKGMWRIDEELRRAQTQLLKSANNPVMRNGSANSSRTSFQSYMSPPSSKHSSYTSTASGRQGISTPALSRTSSIASHRSVQTTLGSRNAAYQKLTGVGTSPTPTQVTSTPPPPSVYNHYTGSSPMNSYRATGGGYNGGASYNGNTSYGAGYSVYGGGERGISRGSGGGPLNVKSFIDKGSAAIGPLAVTVPGAVRNLLRGS